MEKRDRKISKCLIASCHSFDMLKRKRMTDKMRSNEGKGR